MFKNITNLKKHKKIIIAFLFYAIITTIFFWPSIFQNKIPLPTDLHYDYLLDEKKEGQNTLIRDSLVQLYPYSDFIYKNYKNKEIPLWNEYIFNGLNFEGTGQSNIYSPFNVLIFLLSSINFFKIKIILFFFLAGFNLFLFLYHRKYPPLVCFIAGLIWQLSGPLLGWLSWGTIIGVIIWLPLILLSLEKYFKKFQTKWLVLFTIINFLSLTGGHLQFYLYLLSFSIFYYLYLFIRHYKRTTTKQKVTLIIFLILNILIIYLIINPFLTNIKTSHRINIADSSKLTYQNIPQIIFPNFWGDHQKYQGPLNYLESLSYIGILPVFILFLNIFNLKSFIKKNYFWLSSLTILIIYNFFPVVFSPLEIIFPFLKSFPPFRSIFLILFILIILSAKNLANLKKHKPNNLFSKIIYTYLILLLPIITLILKNSFKDISWNYFWYQQITHYFFFLTLIFVSLLLFLKNKINYKSLLYVFLVIVFLDQYIILGNFTPQLSTKPLEQPPEYINFLQKQEIKNPLIYSELTPTNLYSLYNIRSIFGYDTSYKESYYQLIKNNSKIISHRNILNAKFKDYSFLKKMDVNYIITKEDINLKNKKIFNKDGIKIYLLNK